MSESNLERLTERLSFLEAERELAALIARYGRLLDEHQIDPWVHLFCADATLDFCIKGDISGIASHMPAGRVEEACVRFRGRAHLREFAVHHDRQHAFPTLHIAGNTLASIELHEGRASATSHFMRIDYRSGEARLAFVGAYRDVFARDTTGTWRFASRIADITA